MILLVAPVSAQSLETRAVETRAGETLTNNKQVNNSPERSITIMADPSLTVVISLIAREYALKHDVAITTIYSSTPQQIKQIEAGDESDVIISARPEWIDDMQQKGLIDVFSRRNIARNNLVLVGSKFNFQQPNMKQFSNKPLGTIKVEGAKEGTNISPPTISSFTKQPDEFMLVIGDYLANAEGSYAVQALKNYQLNQLLEPYYTVVESAYEMVNMVEQYDVMGVLFRTDAQLFPQIREIEAFSADAHTPLIYQAAAVVGENMELAREFIAYLNGKQARNIFREYGFSTFF